MLFLLRTLLAFLTYSCGCNSQAAYATYDFVIIGGGTAGLTIASRLSEISNISVAVIEAGGDVSNNPNVTNVDKFTVALGTDIDWQYLSMNQTYAAGQRLEYHSGKALGGSSTINGMTYVRAERSQIDSWGAIGNEGWSWDELFAYYEKSESFTYPTSAQLDSGASFVPQYHGERGPLKVGYPYGLLNGTFYETVEATWANIGIRKNGDTNGGSVHGFTVWQSTVDRDANVREDAARAYYFPVRGRPNLKVYINATANKIVWKEDVNGKALASGVEITAPDGTVRVVEACREVILSAGSLRSPAILELSGVGNPKILDRYGISIKVALPAVGENLQDQPNTGMAFNASTTLNGTTGYVTYASVSDFFGDLPSVNSIQDWARKVSAANNNTIPTASLEYLFSIQYGLLQSGVPDAETIIGTSQQFGLGPSSLLGAAFWLLMPFARGSVHVSSANPGSYPLINPNFFSVDFDLSIQVAISKWTRMFWETEPVKSMVTELSPGYDAVPSNATDAQWAEWVKTTVTANSHPLGTCAMMPRKLGGVVDHMLKVYGTENVRVVDASVMPFQVSGHLSSTVYAIAEKAADIIKTSL